MRRHSHPNNTLSMVTPLMDCWRRGRRVSVQTPTYGDVLRSNTLPKKRSDLFEMSYFICAMQHLSFKGALKSFLSSLRRDGDRRAGRRVQSGSGAALRERQQPIRGLCGRGQRAGERCGRSAELHQRPADGRAQQKETFYIPVQ